MDLFYSSGCLAHSAISSSLLDQLDDHTSRTSDQHNDFIRFLQIATALEAPVLPLTWDPAFEALGRDGATGRINQAPLNAGVTFAFKRFNPQTPRPTVSQDDFRRIQYNAMIAEMTILMRKDIRRHPNITTFVGISFELSKDSDEVRPVLVFNKADLGDLHTFLSNCGPLDVSTLIAIGGEVAKGIDVMHRCGVIHGDIKPANVLVETNVDPEGVQVKVADFGFSSFEASPGSEGVKMARTEPWEAPEWHHRYFTLESARKMDFYSFGLLLLWVLFRDRRIPLLVEPFLTVEEALLSTDMSTTARVHELKREPDLVLKCALQLLLETKDVSDHDCARLKQAFTLTLSSKPACRAQSMGELVELLGVPEEAEIEKPEMITSLAPVVSPEWHGGFRIEDMFFHLEMSDYRVHSHIVSSLKEMANGAGCLFCQQNAAYQIAVCYSIGFGVDRDDGERSIWIEKSGKSLASLQDSLDRIKTENKRANFAVGLYKLGYRSDLLDRYRSDGLILEASAKYRAIVDWRIEQLGPRHYSTLRNRSLLVDLLSWTSELDEALLHALSNLDSVGTDVGIRDHLALKGQLAYIYERLGRMADAEALRRKIVEEYDDDPQEKDHPSRMYDRVQLARLLLESGESEKALEASLTVEKEAVLLLGPYHDTSRSAKRIVVDALDATGQLEFAVETCEELIRTEERCLEADHVVLIEGLAILGVQYYRLGKLDMAQACYDKVIASVARKTDNALPAVVSINNYATRRLRHDGVDEGVTILQHLLKEAEEVLGPDREEVVAVMGNLAAAYQKQKKWVEAEPLERRVLEYRCRVLGEEHRYTLSAFGNLAQNLMHQRKWADAANITKRELHIRDNMPETTETVRIALLSRAGKALTLSKAYAEATDFFDRLFPLAGHQQELRETLQASTDGGKPPLLYIQDIALAALCRAKLGVRSHTRRQLLVLLNALQSPWEEVPDVLVDNLTFVAVACNEQDWEQETEQVLAAATLLVEKYGEFLCAPVRSKLLVETNNFLEKKGKEDLYFYPVLLESPEL